MIFTDITSDMGSVIAAEWVSNWSCSFLAELERKKQKAKRKPRKTKKKKQPFHIVSSPVSRGDKHTSGVKRAWSS